MARSRPRRFSGRSSRNRSFSTSRPALAPPASFEHLEKRQVLTSDFDVSVALGGTQIDSSVHDGNERLVKLGVGTLVLSAANTHTGGVVVAEGTLVVRNPAALGTGLVEVRPGAKIVLDTGREPVVAARLALAPGGMIDVAAGKLQILNDFSAAELIADVRAAWDGESGIGSSVAQSLTQSGAPRTLGWLATSADGRTSYTIGFAAAGDANLDGLVDTNDYALIFGGNPDGIGSSATWATGDFNYDGVFDSMDYAEVLGTNLFDDGTYDLAPPPSTPSLVAATSTSSYTAQIAWTNSDTPAGFEVEYSLDGITDWRPATVLLQTTTGSPGSSASVSWATVGNLPAGATTFFRVRSFNNSPSWWWDNRYRSADSLPVSATTPAIEPADQASTLYWDPDKNAFNNDFGTGAGLGGPGTWAASGDALWVDPRTHAYVRWDNTRNLSARFAGAGGAITVQGTVSAAEIRFDGLGYVLQPFDTAQLNTGTTGITFRTIVDARVNVPIIGTAGIIKRGANVLTLGAPVNQYAGDTSVQVGKLNVEGTILSHVKQSGGSVEGVMFNDPELAAAVREALGVAPTAWLTPALIAGSPSLESLTVNSNLVGDLAGIGSLSTLKSLELIPGDYATRAPGLPTLAPLGSLTNLTALSLQDVGLSDSLFATLPSLPGVTRLDVRYNALATVPAVVLSRLPTLQSILVHGNPVLTSNPRAGLAAMKGKVIDVDVAPDRPDTAKSIRDLAERLYLLPLKMLEYVTNTIVFQPYFGIMKSPLATFQTKAGNDWDTNSLLAALYNEAAITTELVQGFAEVNGQQLMDYVGTRSITAARKILGAADKADNYKFSRVWLTASVSVPGMDSVTDVKLDASWKFRDFRPGLKDVLSNVPFDPLEAEYLTNPLWQKKSTAEYYEAKVASWLAKNYPNLTIADVGYDGPIRPQAFSALPKQLPYKDSERSLSAVGQRTVTITVAKAAKRANDGTDEPEAELFKTAPLKVDEVALSRLTIAPGITGQTARPALLQGGKKIAEANIAISTADSIKLTIEVQNSRSLTLARTFTRGADRYIAIGLDANQYSDSMLAEKRAIVNEQQLKQAANAEAERLNQPKPEEVDLDSAIGGLLDLALAQYFAATDADEASIAALTSAIPDRGTVALGIATSGPSLAAAEKDEAVVLKRQFPFLPAQMGIDLPGIRYSAFAIDDSTRPIDLNRDLLLGYANSSQEGLVLEELTNCESVSTMKAFQVAAGTRGLSDIVEIDADLLSTKRIEDLLPGVRDAIRKSIARVVTEGEPGLPEDQKVTFKARVLRNEVTVGSGGADTNWKGVGYTLTYVTKNSTTTGTAKRSVSSSTTGTLPTAALKRCSRPP